MTKLNPTGSALVYSTYLGGGSGDLGQGIAVDGAGNAVVTGYASSLNFPTVNPLQPAMRGIQDVFVAKLNPVGSALVYSTYLGGSGYDHGFGIAVDGAGNAFVTGVTLSTNFPTANPLQPACAIGAVGCRDAFVAKLNPAGSALVYSTYHGGSHYDQGAAIAVDGAGNAFVTGDTLSANFPIANPLQPTHGGGICSSQPCPDAFVTRLNAAGSALVYSTYLGGSSTDYGFGIALDGAGYAFVTGLASSVDFPTALPFQPANRGSADAFVAKLHPAGSVLVYSTYLGGSAYDYGYSIAVGANGNAFVTGTTSSPNFPTANPFQPNLNGGFWADVFVTKLREELAPIILVPPPTPLGP